MIIKDFIPNGPILRMSSWKSVDLFCFKLMIFDCLLQCYDVDQIWQISKLLLLNVPSTNSMPKKRTSYHLLSIIASFLKFDKEVTILLLDPVRINYTPLRCCRTPWPLTRRMKLAKNSLSIRVSLWSFGFHKSANIIIEAVSSHTKPFIINRP